MDQQFFDLSFWRNFVSDAGATLLAVVSGIPTALWIDRALRGRATNERRVQLLQLLREALEKNLALVAQMTREVEPGRVIFYNVDTSLLESSASVKYEVIGNLALNKLLDSIRYELQHLHRKVELQLEIQYSSFRAIGDYLQVRERLIDAIRGHFPRITQEIDQALELIRKESPEDP